MSNPNTSLAELFADRRARDVEKALANGAAAGNENKPSYFEQAFNYTHRMIDYSRGTRTFMNKNGQKYLRGILIIRGFDSDYIVYDTIERMDRTPWMRPGVYKAKMETSTNFPGRKQIRPVHSQRNDEGNICNFLIHPSPPPHNLWGCVAPGYESGRGLEASSAAMDTILHCLGGFGVGKQVFFRVSGVRPAN